MTGNGKLKGLADKPTPLPVVTSITKYQHISNRDLSITNECAKMWGQHRPVFTVQSVQTTHILSNITRVQFVQELDCPIRSTMANICTFFRLKFLHITPPLPPYENGTLKYLPLSILTWPQYYRYHQTELRANNKRQNACFNMEMVTPMSAHKQWVCEQHYFVVYMCSILSDISQSGGISSCHRQFQTVCHDLI